MTSFLKELNAKRQYPRDLNHIIDHLGLLIIDLRSNNIASAQTNAVLARGLAEGMRDRILSFLRAEDRLNKLVKKARGND